MSKLTDEFSVELDGERAWSTCKQAVADIGWGIDAFDDTTIVPRIGVGVTRTPSKIEIRRADSDDSATSIQLRGSIMGFGPIQKKHLQAEMNRLRNAIEVAATTIAAAA
jgi:hypothetical protein